MGSCPASACALEDAPGDEGVAGPKPSHAGEGAASPRRAKPGSSREPTWVGSCSDPACALKAAPGGIGVAGLMPSDAGEGLASSSPRAKPGSVLGPLGWGPAEIQPGPALPKARQAAMASPGRSLATQGRVLPLPTGRRPVLARSPLGWRPPQIQPARPKARQAVQARAARRREGTALSAGRSPVLAGSPHVWGPAQRRPVRSKAHQVAKASLGKGRAEQHRGGPGRFSHAPQGEARIRQGARVMGPCPAPACAVLARLQRLGLAKPEQRRVRRCSAALAQQICCAVAAVATKATAPAPPLSGAREAEVGSTTCGAGAGVRTGRGNRPRLTVPRLTTFLFLWTWNPGRPDRPDSAGGRSPSAHRRSARLRLHWSWSPRRRACHGRRDDGSHCTHPTRRGSRGPEATPPPPFPARPMAAAP